MTDAAETDGGGTASASVVATDTQRPWLASYPKDVNWNAEFDRAPLGDMFDRAAERFADRPAMDFLGRVWSYAEMATLIRHATRGLQALGIGKGDRVGLLLPNCPYYTIYFFAVAKTGATVVNFNPLYVERELVHQAQDAEITAMVTLDVAALVEKVAAVKQTVGFEHAILCRMQDILPFPKNWLYPIARRKDIGALPKAPGWVSHARVIDNNGKPDAVAIDPEHDVAVLQYTGGTTGTPKGAMLTHANLHVNAQQAALWFTQCEPGKERMMAVIPFFHIFALTGCQNFAILIGAEIIALPRFELPALVEAITRKKPTIFPAVPTIYTAINNYHGVEGLDLTSIKACISGGAPLPVEVHERFVKLTGAVLVEGYGLSETAPVACANPTDGTARIGTIGLPVPGTDIAIVSLEDGKTRMPPGEKGEIWIKGPQVMEGYWRRPEATADSLVDGYFKSGDVGIMEADGFVTIVDRIKDLIIAGGYNVYPRRVEEAIYLHPQVEECIVAGVADAYRGETVKAWIKPRQGSRLTEAEMREFLSEHLSPIERPKHYEFRDAPLPKTLIGKLSRKAILEEEATKPAPNQSVKDGLEETRTPAD